jgi:hypothetical protein
LTASQGGREMMNFENLDLEPVWDLVWESVKHSVWESVMASAEDSIIHLVWDTMQFSTIVPVNGFNLLKTNQKERSNEMKELKKLTKEQEKKLEVYSDKYIKIGLDTQEFTLEEAEFAIAELYKNAKPPLPPPKHVIIVDSPYAAIAFVKEHFPKNKQSFYWCFGSMDAHWVAFYTFFWKECDISIPQIAGFHECLKLGWYLPYKDVCIVTQKPKMINRDDSGRLHSETCRAIEYRDGAGLYCWHGITLAKEYEWLIYDSKLLTTGHIDSEKNSELKRVMLEIYGYDNYINEVEASVVDYSKYGTLYEIPAEDSEGIKVIRLVNSTPDADGTFKNYFLTVPPDMKTAHEAVAWTFDMNVSEYNNLVQES